MCGSAHSGGAGFLKAGAGFEEIARMKPYWLLSISSLDIFRVLKFNIISYTVLKLMHFKCIELPDMRKIKAGKLEGPHMK